MNKIGAALCIVVGLLIMRVEANQEFFNLIPTDPFPLIVPIRAGSVYQQEITIQRKTLSRLGIYMRPLREITDSTIALHVSLLRNGSSIGEGDIPAIFIENGGPSYITFADPIVTVKGERILIQITAPDALSGSIALRERAYDADFPRGNTVFSVDSTVQEHVVAFNAFEAIRPALLRQIGSILIAFGFALLFGNTIRRHRNIAALSILLLVACLNAIPAWDASMSYGMFAIIVYVILATMWALLRIAGRSNLSALFGAIVFACSTWLPLHIITHGNIGEILSVRNALIDPNQIAITHGAGIYIGMLGGIMALVGIIVWLTMLARKKYKACELETIVAVIGIVAACIAFIPSPIANGHAGIVVSFSLAWFASFGLYSTQRFLGMRDRLAYILISILATITLLDLMYVTARAFTYGLGV